MNANGELLRRIETMAEEMRGETAQCLSQLIRFKTVSGGETAGEQELFARETAACLAYIGETMQSLGFTWRNHDNVVAVAEIDSQLPFIAVPVHIDVVPVGDGWTHPPFEGVIEDGTVWGRGAQDNKGAAAAMLHAARLCSRLELPWRRGLRLIFGTTEEAGEWVDMERYAQCEPEPEYAIVPDADFPIVNGEKGVASLRVCANLAADRPAETESVWFVSARAGERPNIVPDRAELVFGHGTDASPAVLEAELQRFLERQPEASAEIVAQPSDNTLRVLFRGRSTHGSRPALGHNAAADLLLFMSQSALVSDDEADAAEFLAKCAQSLDGAALDIKRDDPVMGPTTCSLGILNWHGAKIEAVFNIRPTRGTSADAAIARVSAVVQAFSEETGFAMRVEQASRCRDPIYVDPATHPELIAALSGAYAAVTGRQAQLKTMSGTTYAKAFRRAVGFGPTDEADGESDLAHQANECTHSDHLVRNVKIYALAFALLCMECPE